LVGFWERRAEDASSAQEQTEPINKRKNVQAYLDEAVLTLHSERESGWPEEELGS